MVVRNGQHISPSALDLALASLNKHARNLVKERRGEWELLQEVRWGLVSCHCKCLDVCWIPWDSSMQHWGGRA